MSLEIRQAETKDVEAASGLLADTMAEFGVATMGIGNLELEMKALRRWYVQKGNRFSHEFCKLATVDGAVAGLLLTLRGDRLAYLESTLTNGLFKIYNPIQVIRMSWRLMVLGRTKEADKDEYLIAHVAVAPEFRRRGIAMLLLAEAGKEAREQGFTKLVLEVEIGNNNAFKAYEKYGFTTVLTTEFKRRAKILGCPGYFKMLKKLDTR